MERYLTIAARIALGIALSACAANTPASPNTNSSHSILLAAGHSNTLAQTTPLEAVSAAAQPNLARDDSSGYSYLAQSGDTLPAVAARFGVTLTQIVSANPTQPPAEFLSPGAALFIPGIALGQLTPFRIIPDSEFVRGPESASFDTRAAVEQFGGWLSTRTDTLTINTIISYEPAWRIILASAQHYSISPRLLLALLEYRAGVLRGPLADETLAEYPFGLIDFRYSRLERQLIWVAEKLNGGYYGWRAGSLSSVTLADGALRPLDPRLNAATAALHVLFAQFLSADDFDRAIGPRGFASTFQTLFGDPFARESAVIPGNLRQPPLSLPFDREASWSFTGGPHPAWWNSEPLAALDFAPPLAGSGCAESSEWVTAMADGVVSRIEEGVLVLDLDGDGLEQTGWNIVYIHLLTDSTVAVGQRVRGGEPLGKPSCAGSQYATGTHIHVARKFNGEWIPVSDTTPFVLSDWVAQTASQSYRGVLINRLTGREIVACACATETNRIP